MNPEQEPIVLLGRNGDEVDLGLAFHAYESSKELAYSLDGFWRTPFKDADRQNRAETLVSKLIEFSVNARRYLELVGDDELADCILPSNSELTFRFAVNRPVHGLTFIPEYRNTHHDGDQASDLNTTLVGVNVQTDHQEMAYIDLADLCSVFLNHKPRKLFEALEQREIKSKKARKCAIDNLEKD